MQRTFIYDIDSNN